MDVFFVWMCSLCGCVLCVDEFFVWMCSLCGCIRYHWVVCPSELNL